MLVESHKIYNVFKEEVTGRRHTKVYLNESIFMKK